jgi:hypothetical protein
VKARARSRRSAARHAPSLRSESARNQTSELGLDGVAAELTDPLLVQPPIREDIPELKHVRLERQAHRGAGPGIREAGATQDTLAHRGDDDIRGAVGLLLFAEPGRQRGEMPMILPAAQRKVLLKQGAILRHAISDNRFC